MKFTSVDGMCVEFYLPSCMPELRYRELCVALDDGFATKQFVFEWNVWDGYSGMHAKNETFTIESIKYDRTLQGAKLSCPMRQCIAAELLKYATEFVRIVANDGNDSNDRQEAQRAL